MNSTEKHNSLSHICIYLKDAKSQVLKYNIGAIALLFSYDCGEGPVSVTCLCFYLDFGIMIAMYIF